MLAEIPQKNFGGKKMKIKLKKATIDYEIIGTGIPLVMFNGFVNDKKVMKECMEPIFSNKSGWQRVYLDHPGVGETEINNNYNNFLDIFEIIEEFIDKVIKNERFILVGYSFGGFLARYILSKNLGNVDGLLLMSPVVSPVLENATIEDNINPEVINRSKRISERLEEVEKSIHKSNFNFLENFRNEAEDYIKVKNKNIINEKIFNKPVLILTGKQDTIVGYKDAFKLLDYYPRGTYCVLDKAGHDLQIEQEKLFNDLVNEFLTRIEKDR